MIFHQAIFGAPSQLVSYAQRMMRVVGAAPLSLIVKKRDTNVRPFHLSRPL